MFCKLIVSLLCLNSNENPYFADMGYEYPIYQSSYPILCKAICMGCEDSNRSNRSKKALRNPDPGNGTCAGWPAQAEWTHESN